MAAMTIYYLRDQNPMWKQTIERMIQRMSQLATDEGDYASFPAGAYEPNVKFGGPGEPADDADRLLSRGGWKRAADSGAGAILSSDRLRAGWQVGREVGGVPEASRCTITTRKAVSLLRYEKNLPRVAQTDEFTRE